MRCKTSSTTLSGADTAGRCCKRLRCKLVRLCSRKLTGLLLLASAPLQSLGARPGTVIMVKLCCRGRYDCAQGSRQNLILCSYSAKHKPLRTPIRF